MQFVKFKHIATMTLVLLGVASLGLGSPLEHDDRTPELPAGCEKLEVESGNKVSFHAYAIGIQRYRWNGTRGCWSNLSRNCTPTMITPVKRESIIWDRPGKATAAARLWLHVRTAAMRIQRRSIGYYSGQLPTTARDLSKRSPMSKGFIRSAEGRRSLPVRV